MFYRRWRRAGRFAHFAAEIASEMGVCLVAELPGDYVQGIGGGDEQTGDVLGPLMIDLLANRTAHRVPKPGVQRALRKICCLNHVTHPQDPAGVARMNRNALTTSASSIARRSVDCRTTIGQAATSISAASLRKPCMSWSRRSAAS